MGDRVLDERAHVAEQGPAETDADLVLAARTDPRAFGTLYDRYVDTVYRYLHRQTGVAEAAEDLTSLTFLRALAALDRFDPHRPVVPWLMCIAHNALVDHRRTAARTMRLSEEIVSALVAEADPRAGSNVEQAEAFLAFTAGLPEDQRERWPCGISPTCVWSRRRRRWDAASGPPRCWYHALSRRCARPPRRARRRHATETRLSRRA